MIKKIKAYEILKEIYLKIEGTSVEDINEEELNIKFFEEELKKGLYVDVIPEEEKVEEEKVEEEQGEKKQGKKKVEEPSEETPENKQKYEKLISDILSDITQPYFTFIEVFKTKNPKETTHLAFEEYLKEFDLTSKKYQAYIDFISQINFIILSNNKKSTKDNLKNIPVIFYYYLIDILDDKVYDIYKEKKERNIYDPADYVEKTIKEESEKINKDNKYKLENFKHSQTNEFFINPHKEIPEPIDTFEDWKKEILVYALSRIKSIRKQAPETEIGGKRKRKTRKYKKHNIRKKSRKIRKGRKK